MKTSTKRRKKSSWKHKGTEKKKEKVHGNTKIYIENVQ